MNEQDTKLNTLFKKAKNVSLFTEEKEVIRESLVAFMEKNPISEKTKTATAQPSPLVMNPGSTRLYKANSKMPFALFGNQKKTNMIITLLLAFGLTAGTSFAAENSLPGDVLYPVKIHLNEEVESIVAVGAKADAEVKAKHALARLTEAEKLKLGGRLTAKNKDQVESQFRTDVKEMKKELDTLHAEGDTETETRVRGEFHQNAEKHRKNLARVDGIEHTEQSIDLSSLLDDEERDMPDLGEQEEGTSASTTLRTHNDEEKHSDSQKEERDGKNDEKDDRETRVETELKTNLPQLKSDDSREIRSTVDLDN